MRQVRRRPFHLCTASCVPQISRRCRACGTPAATGAPPRLLPGASTITAEGSAQVVGWRCSVCTVAPLANRVGCAGAYDQAETWLQGWMRDCGRQYPAFGPRLTWNVGRDAEFALEDEGGFTLGHCTTRTQAVAKTHDIRR